MYSETKQKISLVSSHCTATKPNVSTNNSNKCKNINLLKNTQILIELECSDEPKPGGGNVMFVCLYQKSVRV